MKSYFKLVLLLFSFCFSAYANDEDQDISKIDISLSAECEPLTTVAGCVNLVSGQFFQVDHDLLGNTIDPLHLTRYYDSSSRTESFFGLGFGSQFPVLASDIQKGSKHSYAMISERDGFLIPYSDKSEHHIHRCQVDSRLLKKGYTNLNREEHCGHSNFTNWKAVCDPNKQWTVNLGSGAKRIYGKMHKLEGRARFMLGAPTKTIYLLTEEVKPNGNKIKFEYDTFAGKPFLSKIRTLNCAGHILNELHLKHFTKECWIKSSCGSEIFCSHSIFSPFLPAKILNQIKSTQNGLTTYKLKPASNLFKFDILNDIQGSSKKGKGGLIGYLQEKEDTVFQIDDLLKIICDVVQFDWGDFFLFKEYSKHWEKPEGVTLYPNLIVQTETTVRAVDNQYIYTFIPLMKHL